MDKSHEIIQVSLESIEKNYSYESELYKRLRRTFLYLLGHFNENSKGPKIEYGASIQFAFPIICGYFSRKTNTTWEDCLAKFRSIIDESKCCATVANKKDVSDVVVVAAVVSDLKDRTVEDYNHKEEEEEEQEKKKESKKREREEEEEEEEKESKKQTKGEEEGEINRCIQCQQRSSANDELKKCSFCNNLWCKDCSGGDDLRDHSCSICEGAEKIEESNVIVECNNCDELRLQQITKQCLNPKCGKHYCTQCIMSEKDELVYFFNGKYRCVECHPNVYCADADIHPCSSTYCDFISTGNSTGKAYPEIGLCCFTLGAKRCRSCQEAVKEFNEENNFVIVT